MRRISVEPDYVGPELKTFPDGSVEGYFGERYKYAEFEGGKYLEASYLPYEDVETLDELDRSHFPSAGWFDYSNIYAQCKNMRNRGWRSTAVLQATWISSTPSPAVVERNRC